MKIKTFYTIRKWIWGPGSKTTWAVYIWDNFYERWQWWNFKQGTFSTKHEAEKMFADSQGFWESRQEFFERVPGTGPIDCNGVALPPRKLRGTK